MQSSCNAGGQIACDKNHRPTIQPIPVLILYFCDFHLMWEPLKGYCYACTLPRHCLIAPKRPQWQKICVVLLVIGGTR